MVKRTTQTVQKDLVCKQSFGVCLTSIICLTNNFFSICMFLTFGFCWTQVKYKEKYEKERGKAMLDFETPTYVTAMEAQHMQSQVNTAAHAYCTQCKTNSSIYCSSILCNPVWMNEKSGIQILCFCVDTNIVMLVSNWDTTISNQDLWIYGRHLDVSCVYNFIAVLKVSL